MSRFESDAVVVDPKDVLHLRENWEWMGEIEERGLLSRSSGSSRQEVAQGSLN